MLNQTINQMSYEVKLKNPYFACCDEGIPK